MESLLISLAVILVYAKLAALLSHRLGLSGVFGELLIGLVLGPSVLGWVQASDPLTAMAELGALVLLFIAGLETDMVQLKAVGLTSSLAAVGGVLLPFGGGVGLALGFGFAFQTALFLGAILTATSVSISAQTLQELGKLRTPVGAAILNAAVIDDVLGVMVLSLVVSLGGREGNAIVPFLKMAVFFPIAILLGDRLLPAIVGRTSWIEPKEARLALMMAVVLTYAWAAQAMGSVAAITGAYLAGVLVARTHIRRETLEGVAALGYGFFIPIFFVSLGLQADVRGVLAAPLFAGLLFAVAIGGKIIGCFLGAWAGRFGVADSFRVGVGMISRGEVALVIATIGHQSGIIDKPTFSLAVGLALVTTLMTPPLLKMAFGAFVQEEVAAEMIAQRETTSPVTELSVLEEVVTLRSFSDDTGVGSRTAAGPV